MKQKKVSVFLVLAGTLASLGLIFLFFVYAPLLAGECRSMYPDLAHLYWPGLIFLWVIALLYGAAMTEYFRISIRIGQNRSFCRENAKGLKRIALFMAIPGVLWPLPSFVTDIGPAALLLLLAAMASLALGMLAWALSKLLGRAVDMKEENDLTV